jgi:hypothetical protein
MISTHEFERVLEFNAGAEEDESGHLFDDIGRSMIEVYFIAFR